MVVKKKKNAVKKPAPKKAVKKVAVVKKANKKNKVSKAKKIVKKSVKNAKKVVKKAVKKVVKKTEKKVATKSANKANTKNTAKGKVPVVAKVEKIKLPLVSKPVVKSVAKASNKMPRQIMRQEKNDDMMDDIVVVQPTQRKKATTLLGALEFTPYQPKADEDYMSDHQRGHFRKILDAWKQQLMQDVDLTVGHLKEDAVFYADPVDRASQEEGFNLELRTRDRERKLIKKIEQSLDLLNMGEYGFCEDCGAEIGIRRLEARPTAVKCIDCKTFQEIREKQLGG
jgi:DnaK suppressor protein